MLDPFQPEKPEDVERIKAIQKDIHEHFIALVKERRGAKLNGTEKTPVLRRVLDRADRASSSALPTASAICARRCASATARKCARR